MTDPAGSAPRRPRVSTRAFTAVALVTAVLIAGVVSIWASSQPDGLAFVSESLGFGGAERPSAVAGSPVAGYALAGIGDSWLSVAAAGGVGCAVVFGLSWVVGRLARRRADAAD